MKQQYALVPLLELGEHGGLHGLAVARLEVARIDVDAEARDLTLLQVVAG